MMKTCTKCNRSLPIEEFHFRRKQEQERQRQCRDCIRQYQTEQRRTWVPPSTPDVKACSRCKETLPASAFGKQRATPTGLQAYCRTCRTEIRKEQEKNRVVVPVLEKRCSKCTLMLEAPLFPKSLKAWCIECSCIQRATLKYNITPEQYREMSKGGCQLRGCGSFYRLDVDHDHSCCPGPSSCGGCVRGILCHKHNVASGLFDDNPDTLLAAVEYLTGNALLRVSV